MYKLNIPNMSETKETKFDMVPFVNTMTHYSLKVLVKRMWGNFQDLANVMDGNRKDVSNAIDMILSGHSWSEKDIHSRYSFTIHKGEVIQYDSLTNEFNTLAVVDGEFVTGEASKAMNYVELKKFIKKYCK